MRADKMYGMNSNNADRTVRIGRFLRRLCFAVMLILAIASFMHFGATGHVPKSAQQRLLCQNNLKQIGLALQNYLSSEGSFPPAYVVDSAGRPVHSWRVLLLPYFDGREADVVRNKLLYEAYRFDEPWDGPTTRVSSRKFPQCMNVRRIRIAPRARLITRPSSERRLLGH